MAKKRDLNLWIGTGRFGRKPELRHIPSGKAVCSASIACQFDDKTEWVNLVFWDKQAELVCQYCDKGSFVRVNGRLQTKAWEQDGVKKYMTEVVVSDIQFLGGAKAERQDYATPQQVADEMGGRIVEPDIPF